MTRQTILFGFLSALSFTSPAQEVYVPYSLPDHYVPLRENFTEEFVYNKTFESLREHKEGEANINHQFASQTAKGTAYMHGSGFVYTGWDATEQYLNGLLHKIVPHDLMEKHQFQAFLFHDPSINAFTTFPGHIYVHPGLIAECRNEDELALVLSHEVAHKLGNDTYESFYRHAQVEERSLVTTMFGLGLLSHIDFALSMKFDREQEQEADEAGAMMICDAGFSLHHGVQVFKTFQLLAGEQEFLETKRSLGSILYGSSHPAASERFTNISGMCEEVSTQSLSAEFLQIRQQCRYEVLKMFTEQYDFRSSIAAGWRYLGEKPDETLLWMTFDALRRYKLMFAYTMDEPILNVLYDLPDDIEDKLETLSAGFSPEEEKVLETVMLGSHVPGFQTGLNSYNLTFDKLYTHLKDALQKEEHCADCLFQLALESTGNERRQYLELYVKLTGLEKDDNYIEFLYDANDLTGSRKARKTIFIVKNADIIIMIPDGFVTHLEPMELEHVLSFFELEELIKTASSGAIRQVELYKPHDPAHSPLHRYNMRNYIFLLEWCRTNKLSADVFLIDPTFYRYCTEHEIGSIEVLDVKGHCTEKGGVLFTLSAFETLKYKDFKAHLAAYDISGNTISIKEAKASMLSMVRKKSLDKMLKKLYQKIS